MFSKIAESLLQLFLMFSYSVFNSEILNRLFFILPGRLIIFSLRKYGSKIGDNVSISAPLIIHNQSKIKRFNYSNLQISNNSYLGKEVFLDLADRISIEENVTISMRVTIITHLNAGNSPLKDSLLQKKYLPIEIKSGSYIGAGAILLPGVVIGPEAVVAAGAVVNRDVAPNDVVAGVPAKSIL